jgi:hypothetical protein
MKTKHLLFAILMVISGTVFSQTYLYEDFTANQMPPAGWSVDAYSVNWGTNASSNAGGIEPEGMLNWSPQFLGDTRLISPPINTTGATKVLISFLQYVYDYGGGYTVGLATRSGGGNWNVVYSVAVNNGSIGPEQQILMVSNTDVGTSDFQFCFFFSGDSYQLNYWYLDNIRCAVGHNVDASLTKLNIPVYSAGKSPVKGTFTNMGSSPITSVNVNWKTDGGAVHTTPLNSLNLPLAGAMDFTANDSLNLTAGDHILKVYLSNVNGLGPDQDPTDDTLTMTLHVASGSATFRPIFEDFTSSTCGPCALFDTTFFVNFIETNSNQMTLIRYSMTWPGTGDPYANKDGYQRMNYYKVSYVPDVYVDGTQQPTDSTLNNVFQGAITAPAFMNIQARHNFFPIDIVQDTGITVKVDINPFINAELVAYIAVIEKKTYRNATSNGETEFHNTMISMIPSGNGTPVTLTDGQVTHLEFTQSLSNTNIERWSDLMVLVWLQDPNSRMIFQSAYSDTVGAGVNNLALEGVKVYPNPTRGLITLAGLNKIDQVSVYDLTGRAVLQLAGITGSTLDLGSLSPGLYTVRIRSGEQYGSFKVSVVR